MTLQVEAALTPQCASEDSEFPSHLSRPPLSPPPEASRSVQTQNSCTWQGTLALSRNKGHSSPSFCSSWALPVCVLLLLAVHGWRKGSYRHWDYGRLPSVPTSTPSST